MKVGLALSGGGARGFAHLGVLKALHEFGVQVHILSGTSAGSIVGAFFAHGYSPDQTLSILSNTGILNSVRPAWSWSGILSLDGFRETLKKYLPENTFEALKIPLTIAATEIRLGKIVYFSEGELITPIIASSSIPAVFNPVTYKGQVFIDGGILDNLPVRPLIGNCDFIIGVHTNPVSQKFDIKNAREITMRSLLMAINVNATVSKSHCNVVIEPPALGAYSPLDVSKANEIFEIGYTYTKHNFSPTDFQPQTT
jgi:NTE family protein